MPEKLFLIRQCSNRHCRFRFPAPFEQTLQPFCPKCGHKLVKQGLCYANSTMSARKSDLHRGELSILLDNVRSALNVGSIIRTCEGIGVKHIYLCGITPTPENPKVSKTALTSESMISWSYHLNALDITKQLKRSGNQVWSLEITPTSIPLDEAVRLKHIFPMILVAGNEQAGVDPGILAISDRIIYLQMIGIKRSLNVAVAVGAASTMLLSTSCV